MKQSMIGLIKSKSASFELLKSGLPKFGLPTFALPTLNLTMFHSLGLNLRRLTRSIVWAGISVVLFATPAHAAGDVLDRLRSFTMDLTSFTAEFEQSLYNSDSELVKNSIGNLILKRPGKFIWRYAGDGGQEFISDGKSIWMFDKELDQVTVNALDDRLGGTPLVLLMGGVPLDQQFAVKDLGTSDDIDWVELIPKDKSTDFEALFIGLRHNKLAAMELRDNLGQATQIQFSNFQPDTPLEDKQFDFVAPKGVDVIGQPVE